MLQPAGFGYAAASAERRGHIVLRDGVIASKGSRS
jgi:hypothetical protein